MNVSCPQCGNPNLDVDPQTNTVFCRQCGFAVQVDPNTGNVTPISNGQPSMVAQGAPSGAGSYGKKTMLGMDALTFFLFFTAIITLMLFAQMIDITWMFLSEVVLFVIYWYGR